MNSELNINLDEPHYKQKLALHYLSQSNDAEIVTVVASRQSGKSHLAKYALLLLANTQPGVTIAYFSYSEQQVRKFYNEFFSELDSVGLIESKLSGHGNMEIVLTNKSKIIFRSSLADTSLRGESLFAAVLDEFAFIKAETFNMTISPMFNAKKYPHLKTKILLCSTPFGKLNHLYKYYKLGLDEKQKKFRSVKFTIFDNPAINQGYVETQKQILTPQQYEQEVLGEFVDNANLFENISTCAVLDKHIQEPEPGVKYYLGVDVGMSADRSCLCLVSVKSGTEKKENPTIQLSAFWLLDKPQAFELKQLIVEVNKKFKVEKIFIEANGQGLPFLSDLAYVDKLYNIEPFNTNQLSKSVIINQLAYLFRKKEIEIINEEVLLNELADYTAIPTATGTLKYTGITGHDDLVMALAIAVECLFKNKTSGQYHIKVL